MIDEASLTLDRHCFSLISPSKNRTLKDPLPPFCSGLLWPQHRVHEGAFQHIEIKVLRRKEVDLKAH